LEYGEERIKGLKEAAVLQKEVRFPSSECPYGLPACLASGLIKAPHADFCHFPFADRPPGLRRHVRLTGEEHEHHRAAHPSRFWFGNPAPLGKT
jgi:hypothetical protein